jgi:hypothetical protein
VVFDATVATDTANSYLTVGDADAYAAVDMGPEVDAWKAATVEEKEIALQRATREIDGYLRSGWVRFIPTQRLLFPRAIDYLNDIGFIPENVRLACYEQATFILKNARTIDNAATRRARGQQSVSEPNVSYTQNSDAISVLSPAALEFLVGYRTASGSRGIRSVRMASGFTSSGEPSGAVSW